MRTVDFRNLNDGTFPLRNGHYERDEPFDHYSETLDSIRYLSGSSALVVYTWFEAAVSSSSGARAVVFSVSNQRLQSVQSIDWSTHSAGARPTWSFDPNTNSLVVRSDHYRPGDAHCCISAVDVVTFRWNGKRFVHTTVATELLNPGAETAK